MLGQAVMAARMGLMTLRSAAQVTGLGIGTLGPVLGVVGLAIAAGVAIWRSYANEEDRAAESARKMGKGLQELPALLKNVQTLVRAGAVPAATATGWMQGIGALPPEALKPRPGSLRWKARPSTRRRCERRRRQRRLLRGGTQAGNSRRRR